MPRSDRFVFLCGGGETIHLAQAALNVLNVLNLGEAEIKMSHINFGRYRDGEMDNRPDNYEEIKDKHVFIFISPHKEYLVLQMLDLIWQSKVRYQAKSVTVVMPFTPYRRQDHLEIMGESPRSLWIFQMLKNNGADRVVICDPHSPQIVKNCQDLNLPVEVINPTPVYIEKLRPFVDEARQEGRPFYVYAPDLGSVRRAIDLAKGLGVPIAASIKKRSKTGKMQIITDPGQEGRDKVAVLSQELGFEIILADEPHFKGREVDVAIRDDELSTGDTLRETADYLKGTLEVNRVLVAVTHAVCVDGWKRRVGKIGETPFEAIFCGDTIHRRYEDRTFGIFQQVSLAPLFGHKIFHLMKEIIRQEETTSRPA